MGRDATPTSCPGWLLDEVACAGRENLDVDHVALYDQKEDADAAREVAKLESLGLDKRSTVVDLGAGTGQFTVVAAQRCARVVAADISPVMLERLRAKVNSLGLSNVDVVHAGFLTYEHCGDLADFVYTRWALHHLPDFWKAIALTRMRAALRTGGVLRLSDIVYSFEPSDAAARIEDRGVVRDPPSRCGGRAMGPRRHRRTRSRRALHVHVAPGDHARASRLRDRGCGVLT